MKNIRFKRLTLMSYAAEKARIINLDADIVIVRGDNHKGKSCILKSIYWTFGAEPKKMSIEWLDTKVIALLDFTIDGIKYKALRIGNKLFIYLGRKLIIRSFKPSLGSKDVLNLFGINVPTDEQECITPASIFMPFYIDQDGGWQEPWSSFNKGCKLGSKKNILNFYTGIIDDLYFILQKKLDDKIVELGIANSKLDGHISFADDIKKRISDVEFPLTEKDFKDEIDKFLDKLKVLRRKQNELLDELQTLYSRKSYCEITIKQLHSNIDEIQKDFDFALHQDDYVICPTCGASYKNDIPERHEMKDDIYGCKDMVIKYEEELGEVIEKITKVNYSVTSINDDIIKTKEIIDTKNNDITLKEFLDSERDRVLRDALLSQELQYREDRNKLTSEKKELEDQIANIGEKINKRETHEKFKELVLNAMRDMGSNLSPDQNIVFGGKINVIGSTLTKAIVAYNYAYYFLMKRNHGPIFCPIVIDEPKQHGIEDNGYSVLIEYLINNKPNDSQLILSVVDDDIFINKDIKLLDMNQSDSALVYSDFEEAREAIESIQAENFELTL